MTTQCTHCNISNLSEIDTLITSPQNRCTSGSSPEEGVQPQALGLHRPFANKPPALLRQQVAGNVPCLGLETARAVRRSASQAD